MRISNRTETAQNVLDPSNPNSQTASNGVKTDVSSASAFAHQKDGMANSFAANMNPAIVAEGLLSDTGDLQNLLASYSETLEKLGNERPKGEAQPYLTLAVLDLEQKPATLFGAFSDDEVLATIRAADLAETELGMSDDLSSEVAQRNARDDQRTLRLAEVFKAGMGLYDNPLSTTFIQRHFTPAQQMALARMVPEVSRLYRATVTSALSSTPQSRRQALVERAASLNDASGKRSHVVIPAPEMIKFEGHFSDISVAFNNIDIESLVQIVMMQASKSSEDDLRAVLEQMKKASADKKKVRDAIATQKKQLAETKSKMRSEYDRRVMLPKGNPLRIEPELTDFDAYCMTQKLVQSGELGVDADGIPNGQTMIDMSINVVYYPQKPDTILDTQGRPITQADVDLADKLKVKPQQIVEMKNIWDGDTEMQVRFGDFERWLIADVSTGGVGLEFPPTALQHLGIAQYIDANKPENVARRMKEKFNLSEGAFETLKATWNNQGETFQDQYGQSMENWLTAASPFGVGLVEGFPSSQDAAANSYLAGFEKEKEVQGYSTLYGVERGTIAAMQDYFYGGGVGGDFATFLTSAPPSGPGFAAGSDNTASAQSFMTEKAIPPKNPAWEQQVADYNTAYKQYEDAKALRDNVNKKRTGWDLLNGLMVSVRNDSLGAIDTNKNLNMHHNADAAYESSHETTDKAIRNFALSGMSEAQISEVDEALRAYFKAVAARMALEAVNAEAGFKIEADKDLGAAQIKLQNTLSSFAEPVTAFAKNYANLRIQQAIADEQRMALQENKNYYESSNNFFATSFEPAANGKNFFVNAPGKGSIVFSDRVHTNIANLLTQNLDAYTPQADIQLPDLPPEPTEPTSPGAQPLSDQEKAIINAASKYTSGGYSSLNNVGNKPSFTAKKLADFLSDDVMEDKVSELLKPVDHTLKQPNAFGVLGEEVSLQAIEAQLAQLENKKETLGDFTEEIALKIQMYQERRSNIQQALSNLMKKMSETGSGIIGNMK